MKKTLCLLITLLLTALLCTSCRFILPGWISGDSSGDSGQESTGDGTGTNPPLLSRDEFHKGDVVLSDDYVYARPDYDAIVAETEALTARIKAGTDKAEDVDAAYEALEDRVNDAYTMESINSVRQSEDLTNQTYADEALWLSEQSSRLFILLVGVDISALDSPYRDLLLEDITEDDIAYLRVMEKLADDEYVTLTTQETELENRYLAAESTVEITVDGKEYTIFELRSSAAYTDRLEAAWHTEYTQTVGGILLEMVRVRNRIAAMAGYANYADFAYDIVYERDYTPADSAVFAATVKKHFTSLMDSETYNYTEEEVNYINNFGYSGGMDFTSYTDEYREYFTSVNPAMTDCFGYFLENGLYSIGSGDKRQQGAFTTYFNGSYDVPFMYLYRYGGYTDITTFIHEFGHFYAYYAHGEELTTNIDICELHSQMNEMLFSKTWDKLISPSVASGVVKYQLHSMAYVVLSGCEHDEFQRKLYTGKYSTVDEMTKMYAQLNTEYGLAGYSDEFWADVHHTFEYPFYYISYAVSAVPAIELFEIAQDDYDRAVDIYNKIIAGGAGDDFCGLLDMAGLSSPFEQKELAAVGTAFKSLFK